MPFQKKVPVTALAGFTHQQQNYFWKHPTQTTEKPHLHLSGTTNVHRGEVTISNLSYTTTTGGSSNENLVFNAATGYARITFAIRNRADYNAIVDRINAALVLV